MILYYQTHSPFARKALVFAHEAGLAGRIEVIHHETSPTRRNERVYAENPLGKVPVLLRAGGPAIFDSDVICAYLDTLHDGRRLIPESGEVRWNALVLQSVAQGLAQTAINLRWETARRPEQLRYATLRDGLVEKIEATYDWLETALDPTVPLHVGHIALATTLSWMEFRDLPSFRARPKLSRWINEFEQRPSMLATPLFGETHD
ncbi:glutathione S-transferase [Sinorhizobium terangae]|uniref:Glutathione S-transferase n=1 Tax=Sinorhizobium terangae TaxID=110322 RepID=A0A6N7LQ51_SINTE|nr:glutathione S-transferase [Sinorhizobium terangae]MBB4183703.1 glutathione S-transferase [Sinorhizobium terangae]MQX18835.1 glutathione S-transferase [Sinorhizobium terangae]